MRCLTLAALLRERGKEAFFVCRDHFGHMAREIEIAGHEVVLLPSHPANGASAADVPGDLYSTWLGTSWEVDADETAAALAPVEPSWLVVDHYAIGAAWQRRVVARLPVKVAVIDGLADRRHDCDMLLDPVFSQHADHRWKGLVPNDCQVFAGPQHAVIRPEFRAARQTRRQVTGTERRIFIAFGGVDARNATGFAVDAVAGLDPEATRVNVIVGPGCPHQADIARSCVGRTNFSVHFRPDNLGALMAGADLAIGSGGTMMWERCFMGLPSLIVSIADNERAAAAGLDTLGAGRYLGDLADVTQTALWEETRSLLDDAAKLADMRAACDKIGVGRNMSFVDRLSERG